MQIVYIHELQIIRIFGITSTSLTNGLPSCTETKQNEVKLTRKEMESKRNILKGNETKNYKTRNEIKSSKMKYI